MFVRAVMFLSSLWSEDARPCLFQMPLLKPIYVNVIASSQHQHWLPAGLRAEPPTLHPRHIRLCSPQQ